MSSTISLRHRRGSGILAGGRHWLFLSPLIGVLLLTAVIPVVFTLWLSVTKTDTNSYVDRQFSDFGQYARVVTDPEFWNAVGVQVAFVSLTVVLQLVLGLFIAMALSQETPFARTLRGPLLAPAVLPVVVVALMFKFLLQSQTGAVSYYLRIFGIEQAWFDTGWTALLVIVLVDVWQFTPLVALLLMAGLHAIPKDYHEAALLDGAGPVRRTISVTIPLLSPVLVTVAVLRLIDAVQVFPTIYILTSGGPGTATNALNYWGYSVFFQRQDVAFGATIAVILTVTSVLVAVAVTVLNRRSLQLHKRTS